MKISIISVVYNALNNVQKTLTSVRKQSYSNIEWVVIDGGSTDGTLELLERNLDIIAILKSEKDDGLYDAMNKGSMLASGDFALYMNAGDIFVDNEVISKVVLEISKNEMFYFANTIVFFGSDYKVAPKIHHQASFFPRSFYSKEKYNYKAYGISAEADFIYRVMKSYPNKKMDIDIIFSRLEGTRVHCYSSLRGMLKIYGEVTNLMKNQNTIIPLSDRLSYSFKSMIKYLAFKIGGLPLVAKLLLRNYPTSKRCYLTKDLN